MNLIGTKLNALNRRFKTILVLFNDLFLAFTCWLVFGPPMATIISGQNKDNLFEVIYSQIYYFIYPTMLFSFSIHDKDKSITINFMQIIWKFLFIECRTQKKI